MNLELEEGMGHMELEALSGQQQEESAFSREATEEIYLAKDEEESAKVKYAF